MKKALIIADHPSVRDLLTVWIQSVSGDVEILAVDNIKDAYQAAIEHDINLFLVDMIFDSDRPGDSSGLLFVEKIRRIEHYFFIPVIMITDGVEDYKLYCYEKLHCYGYVKKPLDKRAITALLEHCLRFPTVQLPPKSLSFRKDGIRYYVDPRDIVYVECVQRMVVIHTTDAVMETSQLTLKGIMEDVQEIGFIRCSRSTIVNQAYIAYVDSTNQIVNLKPKGEQVVIGPNYKKEILIALQVVR